MKTRSLILGVLASALAAFGQGKVTFGNDSDHLYVWSRFIFPFGDQLVDGHHPSGITLVSGLYAGTSSTSLTFQGETTLLTGTGLVSPGRQANRSVLLTIPGGVPQWFRILLWDSTATAPDANLLYPSDSFPGTYVGWSQFFQATPGTAITYPSIMPGGSANSTLAVGNIYVPGYIPEPTALGIMGLGLATFAAFRRNKRWTRS